MWILLTTWRCFTELRTGQSSAAALSQSREGEETEMAQAMRAMQVSAMNGALAGSLDTSVSFRTSKKLPKACLPALSERVRASLENELTVAAPATITSLVVLADAGAANALTATDISSTFSKVQTAAGDAFGIAKNVFQQVFTTVKPAVDVATPYVQQSADYAYKTVLPIATDLERQAEKALQNNGIDPKPVLDGAKTAVTVAGEAAGQAEKYIEDAQPTILSTLEKIVSSDPLVLATGAGVLLILYFLAPPLLSSVAYSFRGFKGELTALQALDLLSKEDYTLVDVRSEKEKAKSGLPCLPRNAKNKFLPIPVEEVAGKVRGQLRNVRQVEAEITAIKIASLKRVNKGSRLVIIDSNGQTSKVIAKSLSALGFNNTWVITDGFDGGKGWIQSKLGTESSNSSFAETLSPSRIIPAGTKRFFSNSGNNGVVDVGTSGIKFLPGPSDE